MSDLEERLRNAARYDCAEWMADPNNSQAPDRKPEDDVRWEAADVIASLSADVERLTREQLEYRDHAITYRDQFFSVKADAIALRANLSEAWSALAMIRETVETLGSVGAMPASEHLPGPTFMDEAEAIVAGLRKMADGGWQLMGSAPKDGRRLLLWQNSDRGAFEGWWHESIVCNEAYWTDDADTEPQPKFWQPLPARPQDGGGA